MEDLNLLVKNDDYWEEFSRRHNIQLSDDVTELCPTMLFDECFNFRNYRTKMRILQLQLMSEDDEASDADLEDDGDLDKLAVFEFGGDVVVNKDVGVNEDADGDNAVESPATSDGDDVDGDDNGEVTESSPIPALVEIAEQVVLPQPVISSTSQLVQQPLLFLEK